MTEEELISDDPEKGGSEDLKDGKALSILPSGDTKLRRNRVTVREKCPRQADTHTPLPPSEGKLPKNLVSILPSGIEPKIKKPSKGEEEKYVQD